MTKTEAQKLLKRRLFTTYERCIADDAYKLGTALAEFICDATIDSPERTLAIRKISEALMYASVGISLNPLEPRTGTEQVA